MRAQFVELISVVADAGSLGAAAIRLNKSQPAVSKALQAAEKELGCQIFQRGPAGVVPTIEGQRIIARCQMIARDLDLLEEEVAQIRGDLHGTLNLIVSPVAAIQILPPVLRRFARHYPKVQVQVTGGHSRKAFRALKGRLADFVIGPAPDPENKAGLRSVKLVETGIDFVTGRTSRYLDNPTPEELQKADWLLIGQRDRRPLYEAYFRHHGLEPPRPILCSDSILTILSMIEGSDLLCSFPSLIYPDLARKWDLARLDIGSGTEVVSLALTAEIGRIPSITSLAFEDMVTSGMGLGPVRQA